MSAPAAPEYQIAGLTADEQPSGRWYDLEECEELADGTFRVKVADTEPARKAGMAKAVASGVEAKFIRKIVIKEKTSTTNPTNTTNTTNANANATTSEEDSQQQTEKNGHLGIESQSEKVEPPTENRGTLEEKSESEGSRVTGVEIAEKKESAKGDDTNSANNALISQVVSSNSRKTATTTVHIPSRDPTESSKDGRKSEAETPKLELDQHGTDLKQKEDYSALTKEQLIQRLHAMEAKVRKADSTIVSWERGIRQILHCIILSPMMNYFYRRKLTETLKNVFLAVSSITKVAYINCSFPSVEKEFPMIKLQHWKDLEESQWKVKWAPSWRITARVEGSHYLSFTLQIKIQKLQVKGSFHLNCAKDLSSVRIWFDDVPNIDLQIQTTIALGILPIPLSILQESIATRVRLAFLAWLKRSLVQPNSMAFPCLRPASSVNEETMIEEAKEAALLAKRGFEP